MSSRRRRDPAAVSCTQGKQVHALVWEAAAPVDRSRGLAPRSGKEELLRQRLVVLIVCCLLWRGVVNDCARQHLERRHGRAGYVVTIRCQRSGAESDERSDVPASAGKRRWGRSKLRVALVACAASCVDPVPTRWQRCVSALAPCCDAVTGLGGWRVVLIKLRTRVVCVAVGGGAALSSGPRSVHAGPSERVFGRESAVASRAGAAAATHRSTGGRAADCTEDGGVFHPGADSGAGRHQGSVTDTLCSVRHSTPYRSLTTTT